MDYAFAVYGRINGEITLIAAWDEYDNLVYLRGAVFATPAYIRS